VSLNGRISNAPQHEKVVEVYVVYNNKPFDRCAASVSQSCLCVTYLIQILQCCSGVGEFVQARGEDCERIGTACWTATSRGKIASIDQLNWSANCKVQMTFEK